MTRLESGSGLAFGRFFLLSIIIFNAFSPSAHGTCYLPDGSDRNAGLDKDIYQPCNASDEHSMCCALNRPDTDICRNDGLCQGGDNTWRESCTDPTWQSPRCIKLCISGTGQNFDDGAVEVLAATDATVIFCDNGSYCCGNGVVARNCCQEGKGLFVVNGTAVTQTAISSTSPTALSSSTKENLAPSSQDDPSHIIGIVPDIATSQHTSTSPLSTSASPLSASTSPRSASTPLRSALTPLRSASTSPRSASTSLLSAYTSPLSTSTSPLSAFTSSLSASTSSAAKSSNKTGVIVGVVIGSLAVLALLIGTAVVRIWIHRNRRNPQGHVIIPKNSSHERVSETYEIPGDFSDIHEAPGHISEIYEVPGHTSEIHEAPGHSSSHELDVSVPIAELRASTNLHTR